MTFALLAAATATHACAQDKVYEVIHRIGGVKGLGTNPKSPLLSSTDGFLYGTTYSGGTDDRGTVYRIHPSGTDFQTVLTLYGAPEAGLIEDGEGMLYGTTVTGGLATGGTVFKLKRDGTGYTVLHIFTGEQDHLDGYFPRTGLLLGQDGMLYGTTESSWSGYGTVYRVGRAGGDEYSTLHTFTGKPDDGARPMASLVQGADGRLFGTTFSGGAAGLGTVFSLQPDGTGFKVLHSFRSTVPGGENPKAPLFIAPDGTLFGSTYAKGDFGGGDLFKMRQDGFGFVAFRSFWGLSGPNGGLTMGTDGLIYGIAHDGGSKYSGGLFRVDPMGGGFEVLHAFSPFEGDGDRTGAALVTTSTGEIYGTNPTNPNGFGTIFRFGAGHASQMTGSKVLAGGSVKLSFTGESGITYTLQKASSLTGPWSSVGTAQAGPDGAGEFSDQNPPTGAAYYRSSYP